MAKNPQRNAPTFGRELGFEMRVATVYAILERLSQVAGKMWIPIDRMTMCMHNKIK